MNTKNILMTSIIALVIILIGTMAYFNQNNLTDENNNYIKAETATSTTSTTTAISMATSSPNTEYKQKTFTISEVASHSKDSSCYSAINGIVYDLTAWIYKHPGGDRNILKICGIDGSAAFNGKHGGNIKIESVLAGFEIGVLAK